MLVTPAPAPDPNWLLSTAAQSAAALVAIIGGFLVSRLVSLSAEREGLRRRHREIRTRLTMLEADLERVHANRYGHSRTVFIEQHLQATLDAYGEGDPDELLSWIPVGSSREEMRPVAESLLRNCRDAAAAIESRYPANGAEFPPSRVDALRAGGVVVPPGEEKVYEGVAARVAAVRRPATRGSLGDFVRDYHVTPITPPNDIHLVRQDARIKQEEELRSEVRSADHDLDLVTAEIDLVGQPRYLRLGFGVLAYFSAVGILLPLFLMTRRPEADSAAARDLVLIAFTSGLAAVLIYLVLSVRDLRRHGK